MYRRSIQGNLLDEGFKTSIWSFLATSDLSSSNKATTYTRKPMEQPPAKAGSPTTAKTAATKLSWMIVYSPHSLSCQGGGQGASGKRLGIWRVVGVIFRN